ncbi:MAG: ABC transporter substrate-binding protein [Burkholderiaceae bacterium]|nr:ABC transporter substrate-binding protein [Burkholderiaceae bacterium]
MARAFRSAAAALSIVAAACFSISTVSSAQEKPVVRIGVQPNILPDVIMRERRTLEEKYADKFTVQWVEMTHAGPAIEALVANSIDITDAGVLPLITGKARGADYFAVADAVGDVTGLVVRTDRNINSVADLKGKTLAFPGKGSWQYGLTLMALESTSLKESDLKLVRSRFPEMPVLLQKGSVDGFAGAEPFMSTLLSTGDAKSLFRPSSVLQQKEGTLISGHVVARRDFIEKHPEILRLILKEFAESSRFIRNNPEVAGEIFAKIFPGVVTKEVFTYAVKNGLVYLNDVKPRVDDWVKFIETTNRYGLTEIANPREFAQNYIRPEFVD